MGLCDPLQGYVATLKGEYGLVWWGYINTSLLIGLFIAGIYTYRKSDTLYGNGLVRIVLTGSFVLFVTTALFGFNKIPAVSLILIGINGFFQEFTNISINTLIQSMIQDQLLAKVYAAQSTLIMITFGLLTMLMGIIADSVNIVAVYCLASFLLCLSFLLIFREKKYLSVYSFLNNNE